MEVLKVILLAVLLMCVTQCCIFSNIDRPFVEKPGFSDTAMPSNISQCITGSTVPCCISMTEERVEEGWRSWLRDIVVLMIGFMFGGAGYIISRFFFRPILKYKEIRGGISSALVYYANALIESNDPLDKFNEVISERRKTNRHHAADLEAVYRELTTLY